MTEICGAREKGILLRRSREMATAYMHVLEEVGQLMETRSEQLFMTMLTDYGVRTCNVMLTNLNWRVSSNEPLTERNG
eukprot:11388367-Heterocapsa_arctica.AAC.1